MNNIDRLAVELEKELICALKEYEQVASDVKSYASLEDINENDIENVLNALDNSFSSVYPAIHLIITQHKNAVKVLRHYEEIKKIAMDIEEEKY